MAAQEQLPDAAPRLHLSRMKRSMRFPSSHHPTPRTRSSRQRRQHRVGTQLVLLLTLLACCISRSSASPSGSSIDEQLAEVEARTPASERLGLTLARHARSGTILGDPSPPLELDYNNTEGLLGADDLKRQDDSSASPSSIPDRISPSSATENSSTLAQTSTSSGIVAAETDTGNVQPLPTLFDMGFNNNITSDCASFMSSVLSNDTFRECLPFSLLLKNSNDFFEASKSLVRITQILDYSCAADVAVCTSLLSSFARNITHPNACASDLSSQNPLIQQALVGLKAYQPLYTASCLRDPVTSSYCFADAITNASNPTDSYLYFLPLNTSLVGGSRPTCGACLQNTMAVYEAASADRSQAVASTYVSAANQINIHCGPQFVNESMAQPVQAAAATGLNLPAHPAGLVALLAVAMTWLL